MSKSSAPDPMEEVRRKVDDLKDNLKEIQEKAMLTSARDQAEDVETQANRVFDLARAVRERGYAWEKDLETKCLDFRKRSRARQPP
jgi:glutamine synthetase type III